MKKLLIPILLIVALISCEKTGDLKFSESVPGGCALGKGGSNKASQVIGNDGVTYTKSNGNLELLVGFNATCCGEFSTSSDIKGDSIIIKIVSAKIGLCDCICYYTYNFKFIGSGDNFKYRVSVDNYLTFKGEIKPWQIYLDPDGFEMANNYNTDNKMHKLVMVFADYSCLRDNIL
jgi:hypothetical protein